MQFWANQSFICGTRKTHFVVLRDTVPKICKNKKNWYFGTKRWPVLLNFGISLLEFPSLVRSGYTARYQEAFPATKLGSHSWKFPLIWQWTSFIWNRFSNGRVNGITKIGPFKRPISVKGNGFFCNFPLLELRYIQRTLLRFQPQLLGTGNEHIYWGHFIKYDPIDSPLWKTFYAMQALASGN